MQILKLTRFARLPQQRRPSLRGARRLFLRPAGAWVPQYKRVLWVLRFWGYHLELRVDAELVSQRGATAF